ncbi:hypothetical protein I8746_03655 [Pseudomonas sp. USTB-Z]|uniref:Uncharacterized protein n=3 Tax=Pseudomonas TaxID=286 RepID=A0A7L9GEL1_9PSED|nr:MULTISPECIES: hypothetical protein [Pseudomonas]AFK72055.1 hypothetical protein YSA_09739 [Pseudomonas putida ND6]MBX6688689.1 hypothetical protein [Pseudomonas sp. USTB-Z]MDD1997006.1 hypothetical protein [Pseudomonas putida]MEB3437176.1 hypothetical protein [Pseudomonas sp. A2]QOJ90458.1 hypothetical protein ICN73_21695 [Pseudomonas taiwanensis]
MNQKRQAGSGATGLAPWVNVWDAEHHKGALPTSSRLCSAPFFPLRPGNTFSVAGDTDRYLLNAAAMLKEGLDLLADAHMGFLGRAGVRLGHVGLSVMSH